MSWVYLDDHFPDHPKVVAAGGEAAWLFVCGLAYVKRYDTEGFIPAGQVRRLTDRDDPATLSARLVEVGLWEDDPAGFRVHDYHEWNKPSENRRAAARKAAKARWDAERNAIASETHSESQSDRTPNAYASGCPTPHTPSPSLTHDRFAEFYALYPRKVGKDKALKAWGKAVERATPEVIIEGLRRQVNAHPLMGATEAKYVPHPSSWLNAGRWDDETPKATASPTRKVIGIVNVNGVQMQGLVDAS